MRAPSFFLPVPSSLTWKVLLLLATVCCPVLAALGQPLPPILKLEQALATEGEPAMLRPPAPSEAWREMRLPDNWGVSRPGYQGVVWYRLRFTLNNAPPRIYAFMLGRHAATRYQVRINGQTVGGTVGYPDPRTRLVHPSLFYTVPYSLLRPGDNEVLVRVEGDARFNHGLTRVYFGPSETLFPMQRERQRHQVQVFVIAGFLAFFAGLFALWAWRASRNAPDPERAATGWFGLSALIIGLPAVLNVTVGFGEPGVVREAVLTLYTHAYAPPLAIALLRLSHLRPRRQVEWLFFLPLLACAVLPIAVGEGTQPGLTGAMFVVDSLLIFGAAATALASPALERGMKAGLVLGVLAVVGLGVHDLGLGRGWVDFDQPHLRGLVAPVLTLAAGMMLARAFRRSLARAAARREELEVMVAARTREIEAAQTELNQVARREAALEERARIMSDMHDGLGGSLVSVLSLAQSGRAEPREIEIRLHELLTELRLTVDSISLPEGDLVSVLASVRYRLREALELSGVELRWRLEELPLIADLTPRKLRDMQLFCMEALTNALRHARARTITVSAQVREAAVEIEFIDDGIGIATDTVAHGWGLPSLARRAAAIGAVLDIDSQSGRGTSVRLRLPLPAGTTCGGVPTAATPGS